MSALEIIGMVGEMLSWVGIFVGLPVLGVWLVVRLVMGPYAPTSVMVIDHGEGTREALWTVGERTYSRPMPEPEFLVLARRPEPVGYFSRRDPGRIRFEKYHPVEDVCRPLALVMLAAASVGWLVSMLPLLG